MFARNQFACGFETLFWKWIGLGFSEQFVQYKHTNAPNTTYKIPVTRETDRQTNREKVQERPRECWESVYFVGQRLERSSVRVSVCESERERERDRQTEKMQQREIQENQTVECRV